MWFELYLAMAVLVSVAAWLFSPPFQSFDPPGDNVRALWSVAAGALWPLVLIGAAQIFAVHYVVRRLRPAHCEDWDPAPAVAMADISVRS
jgi:hypothetical protein